MKLKLLILIWLCVNALGFGQYVIDFESPGEGNKNGYASGVVNLTGINWNLTEALTQTIDAGDWKNGNRSVRMRGYGTSSMTMLENKPNGLGTISFQYRRFGTDTQVNWRVEYSTNNGSSWTQVGSDFTAPGTDVVQTFNETVNISGDVRIRIKRATETGAANRRLNIDDIVLTDFVSIEPEPTNYPTALSCTGTSISTIDVSWTDAVGGQLPTGYLIKWSNESLAAITNPVDGSTANGVNSTTVNQGVENVTITGLNPNTIYYFKIWPYTNNGSDINYKTDGSFPETECNTLPFPNAKIEVLSNGTIIGLGSAPSVSNNTDFGSTPINVPITKSFTVRNIGSSPLLLSLPITLTDTTDPQEFSITQPVVSTVNPNEQTTFTVTFNSAIAGLFPNELTINSNDPLDSVYNFEIVAIATNETSVVGTVFKPGELIFVGYDAQVLGSFADDEVLIANLVDILPGTQFSILNSRYEAGAPANIRTNKWGGGGNDARQPPQQARVIYNGASPIPSGSVMRFRTDNTSSWFNFVEVTTGTTSNNRTSDFSGSLATPGGSPNITTSGSDQFYLIQGDVVFDGTNTPNEANYYLNGSLLHGFTNRSPWVQLSQACNGDSSGGNTRESRLPAALTCFNVENASTSAVSAYYQNNAVHGPASLRAIVNAVADVDNNWTLGTGRYDFDPTNNLGTSTGKTFIVTASDNPGQWFGDVDDNWFNCSNWGSLTVPVATTDVIINSTALNNAVVDHTAPFSDEYGDLAVCNNLTITGSSLVLEGSLNNKIEVFGNLNISNTGILDLDDGNPATLDGEIYLHGDWINQTNNAFEEGNSTVIFTGITPQIIVYGSPPLPPITTEQFYNLTLNNSFNTSVSNNLYLYGNLTINSGHTLTVTDSRYVHVDNLVTNNGEFNIENNGSLVQVNDVDNVGNISMERSVNLRRLDYVYWSSPINGFNVDNISPNTPSNYIFRWDPLAPNPVPGSGGNWVNAAGETMIEGVGYIVRGPSSFNSTPSNLTGLFNNGTPNNGDVIVPVSRGNLIGIDDDDWNLVGNPYPSAIDAIEFLRQNTNLDGFINLWTHGTLPNSSIPDPFFENNNGLNYTDTDYITYNSVGDVSGPGGFNGYIAAGQSFIVNMIDGAATTETLTFRNNLRNISFDNSEFFRSAFSNQIVENTNNKNRIWLDFAFGESDSAKRLLIGYLDNATNEVDRLFDAAYVDKENQNGFYSLIGNKGFLIQGRSLPFVDSDIIPLGFKVNSRGIYKIALHAGDGLFLNDSQDIYLKDNDLGVFHDIRIAPYYFDTEAGEFNQRFEIVFNRETLSIGDENVIADGLAIIELPNGEVQFIVSQQHQIKEVTIVDLLGRVVYQLKGNHHTETYNLSQLSKAAYIAKVTLANGQTITKKAIKRL